MFLLALIVGFMILMGCLAFIALLPILDLLLAVGVIYLGYKIFDSLF